MWECPSWAHAAAIASRSCRESASKYALITACGVVPCAVVAMPGTLPSTTMRKPTRPREVGRGERVLPGVWRLRLPLPWPGVPHCNAWAIAAGDGGGLVDTRMHEPGSYAHLERALDQGGPRVGHIRLGVCTHAPVGHRGQAPRGPEKTGSEGWMHPAWGHLHPNAETREETMARRMEVARQSGVPEAPLQRWAAQRQAIGRGISGELVVDRELV